MNPNFPKSPEDRLLDELLHAQHHGPDEDFLKQIEAAIDAEPIALEKPSKSFGASRIAIAAAVVLAAGGSVWWQASKPDRLPLAINDSHAASEQVARAKQLADLDQAINDQEGKAEESRDVMATIVREKGINNTDPFSPNYGNSEHEFDADNETPDALTLEPNTDAGVADGEMANHENPPAPVMPSGTGAPVAESLPLSAQNLQATPNTRERGAIMAKEGTPQLQLEQPVAPTPAARPASTLDVSAGAGARPAKSKATAFSLGGREVASDSSFPFEDRSRLGGFGRIAQTELSTGDRYGSFIDQPWKTSASEPLSTFSIDVDTASYGNVRRMIREGREIPRDAVRIEECINAFSYRHAPPKGDAAFAVGASLAVCPWAPEHQLVRIAIKGREIDAGKRPASNLVFLIDVSGSMQSPDKLPLLKQSMATLVEQLDERDRVAIVVYAGSEGLALPSTRLDAEGRAAVLRTLANLEAGGSTNGGAGIQRAYEIAAKQKIEGGVNRVILATDGDFNVGLTGQSSLVELVKDRAKTGVYLTVLGFGTGNLNDSMMDAITRDGNGNYFYIDSEREGRKVFLQNLTGTLVTIAKDVKIQVEFNPAKVGSYRLIGYANRVLRNEDFNNDKVDAGDIGAGHTVTAFYELMPPGTANAASGLKYQPVQQQMANNTDEWLTVKLRHKHPEGDQSSLTEFALTGAATPLDQMEPEYQFATAVALFGMKLRGMDEVGGISWQRVLELAKAGLADDANEDRAEFVELVKKLDGSREKIVPAPAEVVPQGGR